MLTRARDRSVTPTASGRRNRRPNARPSVVRDGTRLRFVDRVNWFAHMEFMYCLHELRREGCDNLVLDFSACDRAYPNGMLPLLASADAWRREKLGLSIVLPDDDGCSRLFSNTNWAHFLEPERYDKSDSRHEHHVSAHRFTDSKRQQELVDGFMNVVMRNLFLRRDVIAGLEWSINEITDNVLNHAECPDGGIVQVSTFREDEKVTIGVADAGIGILASLREGHPDLGSDEEAIAEAVKAGTTRNREFGQGNGIAGTLRIADMLRGSFEITSGQARLAVWRGSTKMFRRKQTQRFPGTFVYAEFRLGAHFRLSEALDFSVETNRPVDIIETKYETEDGTAVLLRIKDEATGFGTRFAGRELKMKCRNLLEAEPAKPLVLDWRDIPLVSSSFADELMGKLFVELSPLVFAARVRNVGMEPLVRGLVDKAIMQRAAQTVAASDVGRSSADNS